MTTRIHADHFDLLVRNPDTGDPLLIVEIKKNDPRIDTLEQVRGYLAKGRCPRAMIVSPKDTYFLYDTFRGKTAKTVQVIGPYPTPKVLALKSAKSIPNEKHLAILVAEWVTHATRAWHAPDFLNKRDKLAWNRYFAMEILGGEVEEESRRAS